MAQHEQNHILPFSLYMKVGTALLILTGITVWVAQYHLGEYNLIVAMAIAMTKGSLVALFFMHLKYTSKLFSAVFVGALVMLAVFITLTMADTMSRDTINPEEAHPINPEAVIYRQADSTAMAAPSHAEPATPVDGEGH